MLLDRGLNIISQVSPPSSVTFDLSHVSLHGSQVSLSQFLSSSHEMFSQLIQSCCVLLTSISVLKFLCAISNSKCQLFLVFFVLRLIRGVDQIQLLLHFNVLYSSEITRNFFSAKRAIRMRFVIAPFLYTINTENMPAMEASWLFLSFEIPTTVFRHFIVTQRACFGFFGVGLSLSVVSYLFCLSFFVFFFYLGFFRLVLRCIIGGNI